MPLKIAAKIKIPEISTSNSFCVRNSKNRMKTEMASCCIKASGDDNTARNGTTAPIDTISTIEVKTIKMINKKYCIFLFVGCKLHNLKIFLACILLINV